MRVIWPENRACEASKANVIRLYWRAHAVITDEETCLYSGWVCMAIYSCNLKSVGRSTHSQGTAGAHLRYIAREGAEATTAAHLMPENAQAARTWMDNQERSDRANARLIDKIRVALPVELSEKERYQLAVDYVREITQDRVPWYIAIHQSGKDAHNPHAHIVIRDRDIETGKRVISLSDSARDWQKKGRSGESPAHWIRERWEYRTNEALERAGHDVRVNRRSLEAQGIDRAPTIHIGPQAQHVDEFKKRPQSKSRPEKTWRKQYRDEVPYENIDLGRTRKERNAEIIDFNLEKATRSPDFATRKMAEYEKEQAFLDRNLERQHTAIQRRHTMQEDKIKAVYSGKVQTTLQERQNEQNASAAHIRAKQAQELAKAQEAQARARLDFQERHNTLFAKVWRVLDFTGATRRNQEREYHSMMEAQRIEREKIERMAEEARRIQELAVRERYAGIMLEARSERLRALRAIADQQEEEKKLIQADLQRREREREQARNQMQEQVQRWKNQAQEAAKPHPAPARPVSRGSAAVQPVFEQQANPVEKTREERAAEHIAKRRSERSEQSARSRPRDLDLDKD